MVKEMADVEVKKFYLITLHWHIFRDCQAITDEKIVATILRLKYPFVLPGRISSAN